MLGCRGGELIWVDDPVRSLCERQREEIRSRSQTPPRKKNDRHEAWMGQGGGE